MLVRRVLSLTLAASLCAAAAPPSLWADERPTVATAPAEASPTRLRASVDRAVGQASLTPQFGTPSTSGRRMQVAQGGGGGGAGKILVPLLLAAVSIGGSIFLVKQLKKSGDPTQTQPQP